MNDPAVESQSESVEVRPIVPSDAPGLADLITRCYGDGYPKRVMYRPDDLAALIGSKDHSGAVAEAGDLLVGHMAYSRPSNDATVVEAGITVVDPDWRGRGLMGQLALEMGRLLVANGAVGFVHFPTTAHTVMQKASIGSGGRETGIMVAFLPPETRDHAIAEKGDERLAVTVVYQPALPAEPQELHLPHRYEARILELAGAVGLERSAGGSPSGPADTSLVERSLDSAQGVEHVKIGRVGGDLGELVAAIVTDTDARIVHLDLPLNDPAVDHAVELLRGLGFAYCAWLPGWWGHDVLRLQRLERPSDAELSPTLFSPQAASLMASIRGELLGDPSAPLGDGDPAP